MPGMPCYCVNPECVEPGKDRYVFNVQEGHDVACPKCGANQEPLVGSLVIVHFYIRDKEGPFRGSGNLRYRLACQPERKLLNNFQGQEAATGVLSAVSCLECITAAKAQNAAPHQGLHAPVDANGYIVPPRRK